MTYNFWTDGAVLMRKDVNGEYIREAGGWAFAIIDIKNNIVTFNNHGHSEKASNNEMELMAIYKALLYYANNLSDTDNNIINIYSDSAYSINIYTQWITAWEKNGWTRGKKHEPIQNLKLIQDTWSLINTIKNDNTIINFIKVKGHSSNKWNEYVDNLAVAAKESGCIRGKRQLIPVIDDIGPSISNEELDEILSPLL